MAKGTNPVLQESLTNYVEQNRLPLIAKAILKGTSIENMTLQTGCKGPTAINLLSTDATIQAGGCGFDSTADVKLTQRTIVAKLLKVNMSFCDKDLLKTWACHEVKVAAGRETLPFEEQFTADIVKSINNKIENMIWNGTVEGGEMDQFEGFIELLDKTQDVIRPTLTGTSVYENIAKVAMAMPSEAVADGEGVIFVGQDYYRYFIQELVEKNLYHYNPGNGEDFRYILPGTNVTVVGVAGLNGKKVIVAGNKKNFFYGTDLEGDAETFDLWYSKDHQEFRLAVNFIGGVNVAFPDQIVYGEVTA